MLLPSTMLHGDKEAQTKQHTAHTQASTPATQAVYIPFFYLNIIYTAMKNNEFLQGLLAGVLLTLSVSTLGVLMYLCLQDETAEHTDAWYKGSSYYAAYTEGMRYVPQMQAQDSIDNAVLNLQVKYNLSDELTEELYGQLVD